MAIKDTIIRALESYRGDDYERACVAFSRYSSEEMDKEYGSSGQTRRQILDDYKKRVDEVDAAIKAAQVLFL